MRRALAILAGSAAAITAVSACGAHRHSAKAAAAAAPRPPSLEAGHACPGAPGFTCATLAVPLDHAGQVPGQLRLAVGVQDGRAPRGVLLFLTGGPGQSGVPFIRRLRTKLGRELSGYRLVMFDQRGTGGGALRCPALQAATGDSDLINPPPGTVEACARSIGPHRRFFSTSETVADIDSLRLALHVSRLVLDGVSYGTFVAERYAVRYPAHVARLVLDSVVPQTGVDPLYGAALSASARVLRSVCAQSRCGWDPARDLARLVRTRRDGPQLLAALVAESIVFPDFPGVLQALHSAVSGDVTQLRLFIAAGQNAYGVPASALSQGLHESTLCLDLARPWDPAASQAERASVLGRLADAVPPAALYPFDRASAIGNAVAQECVRWPPTPPPAVPVGNISRPLPPIPVLILAGERDLSTPMAWAQQEAQLAPDGRLVLVPGAGHSVQLRARDPGVRRALARFLDAG